MSIIKDVLQDAIKGATTWVGGKVGGPKGAAIGAKVGESLGGLFERSGAGGEFQVIDTSLQSMPRFGGRMGFNAARMAGTARGYAETVNPETLRASWDSRLAEYYTKTYRVKRTTTLKA